eukprot:4859904-Pyramimonas_sp.AAC.1
MLWQARPGGLQLHSVRGLAVEGATFLRDEMITWALRYLKQAGEKRNRPSEYSSPYENWAYCLRNFIQIRYPQYIPTEEVPNTRMIVDPMALT